MKRGKAFARAGADMVWAEFPSADPDYPKRFAQEMHREFPDLPLYFNYSSNLKWHESGIKFEEVAAMGYKMMHVSLVAMRVMMQAFWDYAVDMKARGADAEIDFEKRLIGHPMGAFHKLAGFFRIQALGEKYLPARGRAEKIRRRRGSMRRGFLFIACALVVFAADGIHAADSPGAKTGYPTRPVRLIVPFAPGGADVPARMLAQKLGEKFGQPFVVDNRPGAASVLGADITAKAAPDGYTLLFATASHAVTVGYYEKLPFDPIKDFAPIASVGSVPFSLATHPALPASSLKEFVALAKAKPGQLNYSSPGTGGIGHLANVLLAKQTGIQVTHVAYKGTGPAVTALIAGEVQFAMPNLIGALPHLKSGKIRVLGVAAAQRAPSAPSCRRSPSWACAARSPEPGTACSGRAAHRKA